MTWKPIAFLPPQYEKNDGKPYSGAVLKFYEPGSTDPILAATDYTGVTLASSFVLNAAGFPTSGGMVIIPHVSEDYKLALYPTQTAADNDSGAVWTVDNITIADSVSQSFVQSFSGDGTTQDFTLSEDLGTDENTLMVFADKKFGEYTTNGNFASDTAWTKGANWVIGAGVATATLASSDLEQATALPIIAEESYTLTFTITRSAGDVTPKIGGRAGTTRNASGTYTETIIAGSSSQLLEFTGNGFTGTLDVVSMHRTTASRREILRPDEFTVSGTTLHVNEAPAAGTSNIIVFAPSLLFGQLGALVASAATSETNAAASAIAAANAQTEAENARDATLAAYDSFDDRYLGTKAADPTVDNDGNPLAAGMLYFSSTLGYMMVYTGSAWAAAYVSGGGGLQIVNNLADLNSVAAARTNLGLGTWALLSALPDAAVSTAAKIVDNVISYFKFDTNVQSLLKGNINGLVVNNDTTDVTNDITVSAGACVSDDGTTNIVISSSLIKRLDATWAVGTNQGMYDTGGISDGTWFIYAICKADGSAADILATKTLGSPTMPATYTKKRRIGVIRRVSSAIVLVDTIETHGGGVITTLKAPTLDLNSATVTTANTTATVTAAPIGFKYKAHMMVAGSNAATNVFFGVFPTFVTAANPAILSAPFATYRTQVGGANIVGRDSIVIDANGQFYARSDTANTQVYAAVISYEDARR